MVCYFHKTLPSPTTQPAAELGAGELLRRAHWSVELLGKETDRHLCPETERNSSSADSGAGRLVGVNNRSTSVCQVLPIIFSSSTEASSSGKGYFFLRCSLLGINKPRSCTYLRASNKNSRGMQTAPGKAFLAQPLPQRQNKKPATGLCKSCSPGTFFLLLSNEATMFINYRKKRNT